MTVYAYVRVSNDEQELAAQVNAIKKKYAIDKWIRDKGTGRVMQKNLLKLTRKIKQGDTVIVYAFDRLGRSTHNVIGIVEGLKRAGASLISVREGIDLDSPAGNMVFQMMCSVAQFESSIISERIKTGIDAAKKRGKYIGGVSLEVKRRDFPKIMATAKRYRAKGLPLRAVMEKLESEHRFKISVGSLHHYLKVYA